MANIRARVEVEDKNYPPDSPLRGGLWYFKLHRTDDFSGASTQIRYAEEPEIVFTVDRRGEYEIESYHFDSTGAIVLGPKVYTLIFV